MIENLFSSILFGILVLLLTLIFKSKFINKKPNLAPDPPKLPFIGNLLQIAWINSKEPQVAFTKLGEKYGSIMSIQLGSVYSVVINSFELMEEYLTKSEFSDRYFNDWMGERSFQKRLGIIMAKYPHPCQELRRFSLRTLRDFGFGKRNRMQPIVHAELADIVQELKINLNENDGVVTFDNYFAITFLNMVWSMLAGQRFLHTDPKLLKLMKVVKEFLKSCSLGDSILLAFPEWREWFEDWTGMAAQRGYTTEMNAFFQQFIDERRQLRAYETNPENLVDEFLREIDAESEQKVEKDRVFTDKQLVAVISVFFMAGSETSSNTLAWCILYLLMNPKVQLKLQQEIDSVVPKGSFPDVEHEQHLNYVRATLAETHRMASIVPLMVPRTTTEDTFCGQFLIPKETYIITNIYGMHHDKDYWKDPENFRPERFLDENNKFKGDPRLKPFGFGKRVCLGEPLASMSLMHYLTVLMQNFTFHPVPNEPLPSLNPIVGVTSAPQTYRALVECRQ